MKNVEPNIQNKHSCNASIRSHWNDKVINQFRQHLFGTPACPNYNRYVRLKDAVIYNIRCSTLGNYA